MKKILGLALALALFSAGANAQSELMIRSKPVLCGEINVILETVKSEDYKLIGKSTIDVNEVAGFVWFLLSAEDLLVIENFRGISCIVSVSNNYVPMSIKKENGL